MLPKFKTPHSTTWTTGELHQREALFELELELELELEAELDIELLELGLPDGLPVAPGMPLGAAEPAGAAAALPPSGTPGPLASK